MLRTEALLRGTEEGEWRGAGAPAESAGWWREVKETMSKSVSSLFAEGTGPICRRTYYSLEGSIGKSGKGVGPMCRRTFLPSHSPQIWTAGSTIGHTPFSCRRGHFFWEELLSALKIRNAVRTRTRRQM
jgi:hypothetical protein